jgi:hypothetical protein
LEKLHYMCTHATAARELKHKDQVKWATLDESQPLLSAPVATIPICDQWTPSTTTNKTLFLNVSWSLFHKEQRNSATENGCRYVTLA